MILNLWPMVLLSEAIGFVAVALYGSVLAIIGYNQLRIRSLIHTLLIITMAIVACAHVAVRSEYILLWIVVILIPAISIIIMFCIFAGYVLHTTVVSRNSLRSDELSFIKQRDLRDVSTVSVFSYLVAKLTEWLFIILIPNTASAIPEFFVALLPFVPPACFYIAYIGFWKFTTIDTRKHNHSITMACPSCGYSLAGLLGNRCPECGVDIHAEQ